MTANQLHQINITFDPTEDRLLLRVNTKKTLSDTPAELCMWITRRFVRLLWGVLEKLLEEEIDKIPQTTQVNRQLIKQMQQQSDLAQADFSMPYEPPPSPSVNPWGDKPLLLKKIKVKENSNENKILYIGDEIKGIHLKLNTQLINSLMKLLADTAEKAEWDLSFMKLATVQKDCSFFNKLI